MAIPFELACYLRQNTTRLRAHASIRIEEVYHGTSSVFLRSILKNGLDPSLATRGPWKAVEDGFSGRPSFKSFGGIYLTANLNKAYDSAQSAVDSQGGNRILIKGKIALNSVLPDEDDYKWTHEKIPALLNTIATKRLSQENKASIGYLILYLIIELRESIPNLHHIYYAPMREAWHKIAIKEMFDDKVPNRSDIGTIYHLADTLLKYEVRRVVKHLLTTRFRPMSFSDFAEAAEYLYAVPKLTEFVQTDLEHSNSVIRSRMPTSVQEAEAERRNVADSLVRKTKQFLRDEHATRSAMRRLADRTKLSMRTDMPLKFSGPSRITSIVQIVPITSEKLWDTQFKVEKVYGDDGETSKFISNIKALLNKH